MGRRALEASSSEKLFCENKNWFCQANLEEQKKHIYWPALQTGRFYVYIHVFEKIKNWGPDPYNSLSHADNRK